MAQEAVAVLVLDPDLALWLPARAPELLMSSVPPALPLNPTQPPLKPAEPLSAFALPHCVRSHSHPLDPCSQLAHLSSAIGTQMHSHLTSCPA